MKSISAIILVFILSANVSAAELIYLDCKLSSLTTELSITLNESTGKVTHTYKANGAGFTSEAEFNPNEISYQRKVANLGQTERFTINRKTLAISHSVFMYGKGEATVKGDGLCKIVKPENNKI